MKRKITLNYKRNGLFNQAFLTLNKQLVEVLELYKTENLFLLYENSILMIRKQREDDFEKSIHNSAGELISFSKVIPVIKSFTNVQNNYFNYKLTIPSAVVKAMKLLDNPEVEIMIQKNSIQISPGTNKIQGKELSPVEHIGGNMNKIFTIKVNKGGVGKTFLTVQLGHGLALQGYKVLLLTSDSQNNILHYTMKKNEVEKYNLKKGLRHAVIYGDHPELYIPIRQNLDFIATESSVFTTKFEEKFPVYLSQKKKEYDFILIDSIPTMDIDKTFMKYSDKLIIPSFCDYSTVDGTLNVIEEVGADKIHSIVINLYKGTKTQKEYYETLKNAIGNTNIIFPEPIKELSQIEYLLEEGKTIWESKSKKLLDTQNSFIDIILEMSR